MEHMEVENFPDKEEDPPTEPPNSNGGSTIFAK